MRAQPGRLFLAWLCTLRSPERRYAGAHSQSLTWPVTCPHPKCLSKGRRHSCSHRGPGIPKTTLPQPCKSRILLSLRPHQKRLSRFGTWSALHWVKNGNQTLNAPELSDKM